MARFFSIKNSLAVVSAAVLLAACGSGSSSAPTAASNLVIEMKAANGTALLSSLIAAGGYTFNSGVPAFGTTGTSTIVAITGTTAAPEFSITSGGATATGDFSFGSCIFNVTDVTPNPSTLNTALAAKDEDLTPGLPYLITISPCTLTINTVGSTANGGTQQVTTTIDLEDTSDSSPSEPIPVTINADGDVLVNGTKIGDVELLSGS